MLFQSINVVSHEESNGPAQFCSSQTIGRQPSLCPHKRGHTKNHYLDGESSHNHREVGFIRLEEVKPQGRHNSSPMFEALLCKRKARFLPRSPRSKEPSTRGEIRMEGILAFYIRGNFSPLSLSASGMAPSWGHSNFRQEIQGSNR